MKRLSARSLLIRAGLLAVLTAAAIGLLLPGFAAIRHEHRVKTLLLDLQRALQDWHVDEETYPRKTPMAGAELIVLLLESGKLETLPYNPWTGKSYRPDGETEATDRIRYSTDELAETYALEVLNYDDNGVFLRIDSTENQSLE